MSTVASILSNFRLGDSFFVPPADSGGTVAWLGSVVRGKGQSRGQETGEGCGDGEGFGSGLGGSGLWFELLRGLAHCSQHVDEVRTLQLLT